MDNFLRGWNIFEFQEFQGSFYSLIPGLVAEMYCSRGGESSQMTALVW